MFSTDVSFRPPKDMIHATHVIGATFESLSPGVRQKLVRAAAALVTGIAPVGPKRGFYEDVVCELQRIIQEEGSSGATDSQKAIVVAARGDSDSGASKRRKVAKDAEKPCCLRFDHLPPDVIVSEILSFLEASVFETPFSFLQTAEFVHLSVNGPESPSFSLYRVDPNGPSPRPLFGYFSRNPLRFPWFLFRNVCGRPDLPMRLIRLVSMSPKTLRRLSGAEHLVFYVPPLLGMLSSLEVRYVSYAAPPATMLRWINSENVRTVDELVLVVKARQYDGGDLLDVKWRGSRLVLRGPLPVPVFSDDDRTHLKSLDVDRVDYASLMNCCLLTHLESLRIRYDETNHFDMSAWFERQAFVSLRKLSLAGVSIGKLEACSFDCLEDLTFRKLWGSDHFFRTHALPSLKKLVLDSLEDVSDCVDEPEWLLDTSLLETFEAANITQWFVVDRILQNATSVRIVRLKKSLLGDCEGWKLPLLRVFEVVEVDLGRPISVYPKALRKLSLEKTDVKSFLASFPGVESFQELARLSLKDPEHPVPHPFWHLPVVEDIAITTKTDFGIDRGLSSLTFDVNRVSSVQFSAPASGESRMEPFSSLFLPVAASLSDRILPLLRSDLKAHVQHILFELVRLCKCLETGYPLVRDSSLGTISVADNLQGEQQSFVLIRRLLDDVTGQIDSRSTYAYQIGRHKVIQDNLQDLFPTSGEFFDLLRSIARLQQCHKSARATVMRLEGKDFM